MNKALILSVRSEHTYNIITGKKTLELRKSVPKGFKGWVYVYVTKATPMLGYSKGNSFGTDFDEYCLATFRERHWIDVILNGTVPFRFWFDEYEKLKLGRWVNHKVGDWNYRGYMDEHLKTFNKLCLSEEQVLDYGKGKDLYAWHIKNLDIFDKPMQLGEFVKDFPYASRDVILSEIKNQKLRITKAPHSYMYAWVKEELK